MSLRDLMNDLSIKMQQRSPEITAGLGIAGMAIALPLTVIGTIKACKLVEERKKKEKVTKLSKKELVKTTWKCYVPAAVSFVAGASCVVVSDRIHCNRNTALATAYSLSERALHTYQEKVIETIGERKEEKIRDEIAKDQIKNKPVSSSEVRVTKKGNTLCFESITGKYFMSDIESIRQAKDRLNNRMYGRELFLSVSDYLEELSIPAESKYDNVGWCVDDGPIDIQFTVDFADDGVTPCVIATPKTIPKYGHGYDAHLL